MFSKKQMHEILNSPDKGISETKGVSGILSKLWRTVLMQLNIGPASFNTLLFQAAQTAKSMISPMNKTASKFFTAGNLRRELEKPKMTFKVLMKGFKLLKISRIDIAVRLYHAPNSAHSVTIHSVSVDLGEVTYGIEDEDITTEYIGDEIGEEIFTEVDNNKSINSVESNGVVSKNDHPFEVR